MLECCYASYTQWGKPQSQFGPVFHQVGEALDHFILAQKCAAASASSREQYGDLTCDASFGESLNLQL